jgi:hypothetical protein
MEEEMQAIFLAINPILVFGKCLITRAEGGEEIGEKLTGQRIFQTNSTHRIIYII